MDSMRDDVSFFFVVVAVNIKGDIQFSSRKPFSGIAGSDLCLRA